MKRTKEEKEITSLDPIRVHAIKAEVFIQYSLIGREENVVWKGCVDAMNEYLRRKNPNRSNII